MNKGKIFTLVLWAVLAIVSYFVGAVVIGVIIGLVAPEMINDQITLMFLGLLSGSFGIVTAYFIMRQTAKNKINSNDSEIIDDL